MRNSTFKFKYCWPAIGRLTAVILLSLSVTAASAQEKHHHHGTGATSDPLPVFVASTAKSFAKLMEDAMAVMDDGMQQAFMNGVSEHDFITMMIPHHQGAVDMAKGMLLYTEDPEIRNLALGIITEQQNEIRLMQAWLKHHADVSEKK